MITQRILIDINRKEADTIVSRVGESDTREINFVICKEEDGELVPVSFHSQSANALFRMVKPDGTFVMVDMYQPEPDSNLFALKLTAEMSQVAGTGYYDIRIWDGGQAPDDFAYTAEGHFLIDDDMITDHMIESVAAAKGLVFPDDFLTSADMSVYATKEDLREQVDILQDEIDNIDVLHTYSTTEKVVGTWIDGTPVYEKVVLYSGGVSGQIFIQHGISDLKQIISSMIIVRDKYGDGKSWMILPRVWTDGNNIVVNDIKSTVGINIYVPSVFSDRIVDYVCTLRYTKEVIA